jgi:radical SAM modification target selenobiotic family peptide
MGQKELKKVLAGLGLATLVCAVGAPVPGHAQSGSG